MLGLNIPLLGASQGAVCDLNFPKRIALDVSSLPDTRFKLHVKPGDSVTCGDILLEDKACLGRVFIAPASGKILDVVRGLKRQIQQVIISCEGEPQTNVFEAFDPNALAREEIIARLMRGGIFGSIYQRPIKRLANPNQIPEAIFVKAVESAPFVPSPQLEIAENEQAFAQGIQVLTKLTQGSVHIISDTEKEIPGGEVHISKGPHPSSNLSIHIEKIHPIKHQDQVIWTLLARDVIAIGKLSLSGEFYNRKIIAIAGEGVIEQERKFVRAFVGHPIEELLNGKLTDQPLRLISGDPLMGDKREFDGFLGQEHFCICALPDQVKRSILHFLGLGLRRYTATKTYLAAALPSKNHSFTTSLHGEERPFVDSSYYEKVMPLKIPTMQLIKALLAEDYELACDLGLLEVDAEDFALPTFICPSKVPMVSIVKEGLSSYAKAYLS